MREHPTVLHLDMDAFYASVEQASKPSLRGRPVVVGGLGPRGVVATASYEARRHGVRSAMPTARARRLCPHAAYLIPRFTLYREISSVVMGVLGELSPLVEPLSLDEAFVDLAAGPAPVDEESARAIGEATRARIRARTGLTASVGLAGSKMLAKIASEQAKPNGLAVIPIGAERSFLEPLPIRILPGVGPVTGDTLRRAGIVTAGDAVRAGEQELIRLLGRAHGTAVHAMAAGRDNRPVVAERDAKSVSAEDTFDEDLTDRARLHTETLRLADRAVRRLRDAGRSARTVVLKIRFHDFTTLTRSETLRGATDDPVVVRDSATRLLAAVGIGEGVRLLGVGLTGLAEFTQEDLFALAGTDGPGTPAGTGAGATSPRREDDPGLPDALGRPAPRPLPALPPAITAQSDTGTGRSALRPAPGRDVHHAVHGPGWIQGSGLGRVTVRFERPDSPPGRAVTLRIDDPALREADPLPLVAVDQSRGPAVPPPPSPEILPVPDGPGESVPVPDGPPASRPKSRSSDDGADPPGTSSP